MQVCHCLIQIGLRRGFSGEKLLRALSIQFCQFQRSLRAGYIALGLSDRGLEKGRINLRHDLAGFDLRIKVGKQLRDVA